jgi:uncharacterized protein (DUF2141 family)
MIAALALLAAVHPALGTRDATCAPGENGPAFIVTVDGLKDRRGRLRLELYPANDADFLADDDTLVAAGKPFRRVDRPVPATGPVTLCLRAPGPGLYAISLLHDRDANHRFSLWHDGVGFAGNPTIGWWKPHARAAAARVGDAPTRLRITLNYRHGLFSFAPIDR